MPGPLGHRAVQLENSLQRVRPAYAYDEIGRLDTRLPFAELKRLSHINARAQAAGDAPDFSQRIRAGLPMPPSSR